MKRTSTILMALILGVGVTFANGNEENKKASKESKTALHKWDYETHRLFYTGKQAGKVNISIKNEDGQIIQKLNINNDGGFSIPLKTSLMESGNYVVEITDGEGTSHQYFSTKF